ncbi:hypothetical protein [Cryobacterium sp. Y82]|uniref:hypothetical protein n=1 Tax=Cryobacterium sp. Y82 TaxID=2045017 RepID=UPI000CE530B7|nr:hypothetical protein [Cryobacterium sp. Y82]
MSIVAYESDPVSGLDGQANAEVWETISADNGGGGGFDSHNILRYAKLANSPAGTPQRGNHLGLFFGTKKDSIITDYQGIEMRLT